MTRILALIFLPRHRSDAPVIHYNSGKFPFDALEAKAAAMVRNNFLGDVQPKAGPFAERLGGKERLGQHGKLMRGIPTPRS
jgi:hypothetical protein